MTGGERFVAVSDGTRLHVTDSGNGPPVLLLHGLSCTGRMWGEVRSLLLASRRVIVADLRGHGASRPAVNDFSLNRQADDVRQLVEGLDLRNAEVLGHSAGGYAVLAFAARHPTVVQERLRGIVTVGTSGSLIHARERAVLKFSATRAFYALYGIGPVGRRLIRLGAFGDHPPEGSIEETRQMTLACPRQTKVAWVRAIVGSAIQDQLADLRVPLVAATGSRDLTVTPKAVGALASSVPVGRAVVLDHAGHMAPREVPDQIAQLVTAH